MRTRLALSLFITSSFALSSTGFAQDAGVGDAGAPVVDAGPAHAATPEGDAGTATNPPTVNPPTVNPPTVNPPAVNPPAVNPPAVNPPVDPPADADTDTDSGLEADENAPAEVPTGYSLEDGATAAAGEARSMEAGEPVEAEDIALFVPRLVLFVPRILLTGLFWPIRELIRIVERHAIVEHVENLIYWNDAHTVGLRPVIGIETPFGISGGATLFHDDLLGYDESLSLSARFGGRYSQAYELAFEADRFAGSRLWLESRARFEANPGLYFAGLGVNDTVATGPGADPRQGSLETFYRTERWLGMFRTGVTIGKVGNQLQLGTGITFNRRTFGANEIEDVSTEEVFDTALIPGFNDTVSTIEVGGSMVLDTRAARGLDSRGVYLEMFGGYVPPTDGYEYVHYGAEFTWTINLFHRTRLLVLRAGLEAVHGHENEIPFTDLPRLGGPHRLRGYPEGRFRDRIAVFGTAEYRYPIHRNVMGYAFLDAGHVAREYGDLFSEVRFGGGGGLLIGSDESIAFRLDISYGESVQVFLSTDLASAFQNRGEQL